VPANRADLLFDEIEVVDQPFGGRRVAAILDERRVDEVVRLGDDPFVVVQSRQQSVGFGAGRKSMTGRGDKCLVAELIEAIELRSQRLFLSPLM
jgi:hypothetical protein